MRDYGKVPSPLWSDPRFTALTSDAPRFVLLYLMSTGHGTIAGVFRLPDGYVAEDLGSSWTAERVAEAFSELSRNGFMNRCEATKWVWMLDHFKWNALDNPNQRKAAAKCVLLLPDQCVWKRAFMRVHGEMLGLPVPSGDEPLLNRSETLGESITVTVAITEQQQKASADKKSGRMPREFPGFTEFWSAYPRKVAKDAALKAFAKRKPTEELLATMLSALEIQRDSEQWRKNDGQFVPHPATWLNDGRWQDEASAISNPADVFQGAF